MNRAAADKQSALYAIVSDTAFGDCNVDEILFLETFGTSGKAER
jgi:hypothetical protein